MSLSRRFMRGFGYELELVSDSCSRVEVWPHIRVPVIFMPGSVSPLCKIPAKVSILVYVKVRVQALNIVHVTITLCSVLYSCRTRAKLRIRGLVMALDLQRRIAFVSNSRSC